MKLTIPAFLILIEIAIYVIAHNISNTFISGWVSGAIALGTVLLLTYDRK